MSDRKCENCGENVDNIAPAFSYHSEWVHHESQHRECGRPDVAIPVSEPVGEKWDEVLRSGDRVIWPGVDGQTFVVRYSNERYVCIESCTTGTGTLFAIPASELLKLHESGSE